MAVVKGKAMWCHISQPNTKFEPCWSVDLVPEDSSVIEDFRSKGYRIKQTKDGEDAITFKRKVKGNKGGENKQPKLVDAEKNPINELVGNGSIINVQYNEWATENSFGSFQGLDLKGIQVLELVSYGVPDGDEFESYDEASEF